jgi:hypothetical protein
MREQMKPVAWRTEDHLTDKSATTYDSAMAELWRAKGWPVHAMYDTPPIVTTLHENGELIAAQATIAQQAQMIEHLRGGPTPLYTAVDMATADSSGFQNGRKSVGLLLGKGFNTLEQSGGKYSIKLEFQNADDAYAAYTEIATIVRLAGEA